VNTPERIAALAGTRQRPEYSMHYDQEGANGEGSVRVQHQFKVEPNTVRSLKPGEAYLISRGSAMRARILTAPRLSRPLPETPTTNPGTETTVMNGTVSPSTGRLDRKPNVPPRNALSEKEVKDLPF
jgi:hypothetical protein